MDTENPTLTLRELAQTLGAPDPATLTAYTEESLRAEFVRNGTKIASPRVITDTARVYGLAYDFFSRASDAQKQNLIGFSTALLAVAVHYAVELEDRVNAIGGANHAGGVAREGRGEAARRAFSRGLVLRDHAASVLHSVAVSDPVLVAKVGAAIGTAETPEALARGLEALAKLGRDVLASTHRSTQIRATLARLDDGYVQTLVDAAAQTRATALAETAPRNDRISQGELDWLDGVNLHLLGDVIHVFEASHDLDPSIPKLVPIATRRLLGRRKPKATAPETVPTAPPPVQPAPATP